MYFYTWCDVFYNNILKELWTTNVFQTLEDWHKIKPELGLEDRTDTGKDEMKGISKDMKLCGQKERTRASDR